MTDHERFTIEDEAREAFLAGYHRRLHREMAAWEPEEDADGEAGTKPIWAAVALIIAVSTLLAVAFLQ